LKNLLLLCISFISLSLKAQRLESFYVNLYTDSLKKGTYNYINIDGLLSNGKYIPLTGKQIYFSSSHGKFYGNSLWIDSNTTTEKVMITVKLIADTSQQKSFEMYVKIKKDEALKTEKELLDEIKQPPKNKNKN